MFKPPTKMPLLKATTCIRNCGDYFSIWKEKILFSHNLKRYVVLRTSKGHSNEMNGIGDEVSYLKKKCLFMSEYIAVSQKCV